MENCTHCMCGYMCSSDIWEGTYIKLDNDVKGRNRRNIKYKFWGTLLFPGNTGNQYDGISAQERKCKTWGEGVGTGQIIKASINNFPSLVKKKVSIDKGHTDEGGKL